MRVNQKISIGSIRINSMSNSSIVQIGASGAIKARSEDITEQVDQATATKKMEKKVIQEVMPLMEQQGLRVTKSAEGGTDNGNGNGTND